jgi:hypothetical protein
MTGTRIKSLALAAALSISPAVVGAQTPPPEEPDASLLTRADSITVGDYCSLAQQIMSDSSIVRALGADSSSARTNAAVICNPLLSRFSLLALTGRAPAPLGAVARLHTNVYSAAQLAILDAMSEFRADVRQPDLRPIVAAALDTQRNAEFVRVSETAHSLVVVMARDRALQRLANYERKLGPTSARLNLPEVVLNYAAQRWVPGFRPTPLRGPSPWEVVASFVPAYITFADHKAQPIPVSTAEFGVRRYLFGDGFGRSGFKGILRPSYWSVGVLTASDEDGALVWPWRGRDHSGAYVSWGAIKVGYINRERGAWLVSKQFQAIPFIF